MIAIMLTISESSAFISYKFGLTSEDQNLYSIMIDLLDYLANHHVTNDGDNG